MTFETECVIILSKGVGYCVDKAILDEIRENAERYRFLYLTNQCSREEAKLNIQPYLDEVNKTSIEIAKKYKQKPKFVGFAAYTR